MLSSRFVFFTEPVHIAFVVVRALAIGGGFVVAASTSKVRGSGMIRSRQCPVWNAIAVDVGVPPEASQLFQIFDRKDLSTIKFIFRIFERVRHYIIHYTFHLTNS